MSVWLECWEFRSWITNQSPIVMCVEPRNSSTWMKFFPSSRCQVDWTGKNERKKERIFEGETSLSLVRRLYEFFRIWTNCRLIRYFRRCADSARAFCFVGSSQMAWRKIWKWYSRINFCHVHEWHWSLGNWRDKHGKFHKFGRKIFGNFYKKRKIRQKWHQTCVYCLQITNQLTAFFFLVFMFFMFFIWKKWVSSANISKPTQPNAVTTNFHYNFLFLFDGDCFRMDCSAKII